VTGDGTSRGAPPTRRRSFLPGWVAISAWCYLVWLLLTAPPTTGSLIVGAVLALGCGPILSPLGPLPAPWSMLRPGRLWAELRLGWLLVRRVIRANGRLLVRVWSPKPPGRTGMVVVPTRTRSDGAAAAVGLLTSLVVDNQLVDLDLRRHQMLYHCIDVPAPERRYEATVGPIESLVLRVEAGRG
jgi:multicomponent Na+:H+ antiporter subunit E